MKMIIELFLFIGFMKNKKMKTKFFFLQVRGIVSLQTKEWSELLKRQQNEEYTLKKQHCREQWEQLRKLLNDAQQFQLQNLRQKHEVEAKLIRQSQTKKSMDDSKSIQNDRSIKTKAEKDRSIIKKKKKIFFCHRIEIIRTFFKTNFNKKSREIV